MLQFLVVVCTTPVKCTQNKTEDRKIIHCFELPGTIFAVCVVAGLHRWKEKICSYWDMFGLSSVCSKGRESSTRNIFSQGHQWERQQGGWGPAARSESAGWEQISGRSSEDGEEHEWAEWPAFAADLKRSKVYRPFIQDVKQSQRKPTRLKQDVWKTCTNCCVYTVEITILYWQIYKVKSWFLRAWRRQDWREICLKHTFVPWGSQWITLVSLKNAFTLNGCLLLWFYFNLMPMLLWEYSQRGCTRSGPDPIHVWSSCYTMDLKPESFIHAALVFVRASAPPQFDPHKRRTSNAIEPHVTEFTT